MATITPLSAIPSLGSATLRTVGHWQENQTDSVLGNILKAIVIEAKPNNRYLLDFEGTRILTSSKTPLSPGSHLQLQVTSIAPQVELKIVPDVFSALAGKSLVLLGNNLDLTALFSSLQSSVHSPLASLSLPSSDTLKTFLPTDFLSIITSSKGGEFLTQIFNRLGFNMERLLAQGIKQDVPHSLKAALLEIAHRFEGMEKISEQAGKLLTTLELFQLAQLQLNQDKVLLFPLPLPFLEQGYLLVEQDEKGQEQEKGESQDLRFSLHVSLSEIGNIKIDILRRQEGLIIRFNLDSKEKADFVSQFGDILKEAISTDSVFSLTFSDSAGDPAAELIRRVLPRGESILDTTA